MITYLFLGSGGEGKAPTQSFRKYFRLKEEKVQEN